MVTRLVTRPEGSDAQGSKETHQWVERLKASLPNSNGPPVEIVHVAELTGPDGAIRYPRGAHSIQMRPPEGERRSWLIWYWYSGSDAAALDAAAEWFWGATQAHFAAEPALQVRVSPLETISPALQSAGLSWHGLTDRELWRRALCWSALFFCGCYLPTLAVSQERERGTVFAVVTSPLGWRGWARGIWLFHAALAALVAAAVVAIAPPDVPLLILVPALALALAAYLGVAFVLGCCCRSVASASAALMLYLAAGGLTAAAFHLLPTQLGALGFSSVEACLLKVFSRPAEAGHDVLPAVAGLAAWALLWLGVARISFQRLSTR